MFCSCFSGLLQFAKLCRHCPQQQGCYVSLHPDQIMYPPCSFAQGACDCVFMHVKPLLRWPRGVRSNTKAATQIQEHKYKSRNTNTKAATQIQEHKYKSRNTNTKAATQIQKHKYKSRNTNTKAATQIQKHKYKSRNTNTKAQRKSRNLQQKKQCLLNETTGRETLLAISRQILPV
ncbi:hypothetical protein AMECASPLE_032553 [Ameca splendens]|uniref:Secreted protein n=1 Tax=Ameca splendens TaxID=208324 RepID=A0ABV0YTK6_9TELE